MPDYERFIARDYATTPRTKRRHIRYWILFMLVVFIVVLLVFAGGAN